MGQYKQVRLCDTCGEPNAIDDQYCKICHSLLPVPPNDEHSQPPKRKGRSRGKVNWKKIIVAAAVIFCLVFVSMFLYVFKINLPSPNPPLPPLPTTFCLATDLPTTGLVGPTGRD